MKTKIHITGKIKGYDKINHISLRLDIENENILNTLLTAEGKINESPETWVIDCESDGMLIDSFLYGNKYEYEQDLEILGLKNK